MEEVDMASEDIFSGPIGESVPSSSVGFMHRRESVAESITSFTYYDEEEHEGSDGWLEDGEQEEEAILDREYDGQDNGDSQTYEDEQAAEEQHGFADQDTDVEAQETSSRRPIRRRKSSGLSRHSRTSLDSQRSKDPLLKRSDSQGSHTSATSGKGVTLSACVGDVLRAHIKPVGGTRRGGCVTGGRHCEEVFWRISV